MHRHPIIFCSLILLILIGNQQLRADDRLPSQSRSTSTSKIPYDQLTGDYLPYNPVKTALGKVLEQWSAASRFLSPKTPSPKAEEFKKRNQAYFSGHELTLISEFQQPVSTKKLRADYDWRVVKQTKTKIILRGQPRDVLTRHLCRPFELQISAQSMMPESLTFLSDSAKQKQGFASIELTAFKVTQTKVGDKTVSHPQTVLRTVAKAVFSQEGSLQNPKTTVSPIKRISFSTSSSDYKNQADVLEIEKLVSRWITESQRIGSIKLGNGTMILKPGEHRDTSIPRNLYSKPDGTTSDRILPYQSALQPWLIDVDQKIFVIESFTIELSADDKGPSAPRFITLKIKPNPAKLQNRPASTKWDAVEIVFNSEQALPIKISETRNNRVLQFLLSDIKIQYEE